MKTIKGPAIFLAQFAGDAAPFNSLNAISRWAAALGYKGVQVPSWDSRLFAQSRRNLSIQIARRSWYLIEDCMMKYGRGIARKCTLPGCHFTKHQTEREQISPLV